ncbi:MAG: SAM-dependent methyltransferase [Crocinitomicaceae bacterium]|nr:SAM-dependent methyltransferase [Crocinitomicaceae bacterium]
MNEDELKALAEQLRNPNGKDGIETAETMHETNIRMTHHSIDLLNIKENNTILELGHGSCKHLPYLLKQHKNLSYHGLETSELMFSEAKRINGDCIEHQKACFHHYDGIMLPFDHLAFDRVFTVNTIYFWRHPKQLLLELYRVMKTEGILNITFAEQEFMQQLPFTPFGFRLYNLNSLNQLVNQTPFKMAHTHHQTEKVKSKTGNWVYRRFVTASFIKEQ